MRKILKTLPLLALTFGIAACDFSWAKNFINEISSSDNGSQGGSKSNGGGSSRGNSSNNRSSSSASTIDPNIPQDWINLFTFTNVTIKYQQMDYGTRVIYYKFVDSIFYIKEEGDTAYKLCSYEPDFIYINQYSLFTYDESDRGYHMVDYKKYADNDWVYDVDVYATGGHINNLVVTSHYASVYIPILYTFSNYGYTTLEE